MTAHVKAPIHKAEQKPNMKHQSKPSSQQHQLATMKLQHFKRRLLGCDRC